MQTIITYNSYMLVKPLELKFYRNMWEDKMRELS